MGTSPVFKFYGGQWAVRTRVNRSSRVHLQCLQVKDISIKALEPRRIVSEQGRGDNTNAYRVRRSLVTIRAVLQLSSNGDVLDADWTPLYDDGAVHSLNDLENRDSRGPRAMVG